MSTAIEPTRADATPTPPPIAHPVITAAQGMFLILNAASLRRLPMPFAAKAYDYSPIVDLQFATRVDVATWAAALDVAELVDEEAVHVHGVNDQTFFEAVWHDVPIRVVASVPRGPR